MEIAGLVVSAMQQKYPAKKPSGPDPSNDENENCIYDPNSVRFTNGCVADDAPKLKIGSDKPWTARDFAVNKIKDACGDITKVRFGGIVNKFVNTGGVPFVTKTYPLGDSKKPNEKAVLHVSAHWNSGDKECAKMTTGRQVDAKECDEMLRWTIDSCDTLTVDFKHGGRKIKDCVMFSTLVTGKNDKGPSKQLQPRPA